MLAAAGVTFFLPTTRYQLGTTRDIGYLVMDIDRHLSDAVHERIAKLPVSVKTRILF